jgi:hypothetical protein
LLLLICNCRLFVCFLSSPSCRQQQQQQQQHK